MRRYDVISEICDAMLELGWGPYQNDHEDANGQFEMNWHYDDALKTADRHAFFKYMVEVDRREARASRHLHAEAVLEPDRQRLPRARLAVAKDGKNLFEDAKDELGLSQARLSVHRRADAFGARRSAPSPIRRSTPTSASTRRARLSGATWSPNTVTYTGNNRTHMIRIPDAGRFEFRLADGAANPYCLQAAVLAAGLDGIAQQARSRQARSTSTCIPRGTR